MQYEVVIGLEVHVELATNSKLFCNCSAKFGAEANENVCPACSGMPGFLPVLNKNAVELGIKAGLVTNSEITEKITFDKKNYFYPDLPAGYQITQLFSPICKTAWLK
jgi:aspartyl-tRNA(Asn)/glutamyl-tRNA(Gln) amidotransferase subunit B